MMRMRAARILLLLLLLWMVLGFGIGSGSGSSECESLGFTGLALCSDCHTLGEYLKLKQVAGGGGGELVADCLKCCVEDSGDATSKVSYGGAVLEVCMRKLVFYPEIVAFVEDASSVNVKLKVNYVFNSPPKLIMLDHSGLPKDTIRIDNWNRHHLLQFLRDKVSSSSSA